MRNRERELVDTLVNYLRTQSFSLYDGTVVGFTMVTVGRYPERAPGFPVAVVVPLGPVWENVVLGGGSRLDRIARRVQVAIEVHYEHVDPEVGLYHMSDIFNQLVEGLLAQPRLLDEVMLRVVDTDYSYAIQDQTAQESEGPDFFPDWGYKGVGVVVLEAEWR
ncbi:capsid protein [Thermus phage phiFa]|nr:capsid protein [Thermus phage phiFa]